MKGKWVQVGRNLNIQGMSYLVSFLKWASEIGAQICA